MTTTQTTTETFDRMVAECLRARFIFETSRIGSAKGVAAERKIDRLVARAERLGFLAEFCTAVNAVRVA